MDTWAFDPPCSMEPVAAVPNEDWFSETSVPGPPEEIRGCVFGGPLLPLEEPPTCPSIARVVRATTRTVAAGNEYLTMSVSEAEGCAYRFGLDGAFPVACPDLPAAPVYAEIERVPPGSEYVMIHLTRESASSASSAEATDACAFALRVRAGFPDYAPRPACTPVYKSVVTSRMVPPEWRGADLEISSYSDCSWTPTLDLHFPCIPPPAVRRISGSYVVPGAERIDLGYFSASGDTCSYSGDLTLDLPRPGGMLGKVLSGTGTSWSVRLYPNGPTDEAAAFDQAITVQGAPSTYVAPVDAWIAPVQPFAPWGRVPDASQWMYALASFLGLEIVVTPVGGITAGGTASCALQRLSGGSVVSAGTNVTVRNVFSSTVGSGARRVIVGRIDGQRVAIAEDCVTP